MRSPLVPATYILRSAGVIGLSCALKIQHLLSQSRSSENTEVLLVAKEWPTSIPGAPWEHSVDYASMWAGAHVRPEPASTAQKTREAAWLKQTCQEFKQLLQTEPWVGVTKCQGIEHLEAPGEDYENQTDESFSSETGLDGYRRIAASELPHGVALGFTYETYCVNAPVYCANLLRKFISQGGKTLKRDLRSEWEAFAMRPAVKLVINASGTGFGDLKSFPTRGSSPERTIYPLLMNRPRSNSSDRSRRCYKDSDASKKGRIVVLYHPALLSRRHHHRGHQTAWELAD